MTSCKPSVRLFTAALVSSLLAGLSACTHMLTPLGDDKYDCNRKENPASPYCHSFRSVEQGTNGALPDSRYDQVMRLSDHDRLTGIAPDESAKGQSTKRADQGQSAAPPIAAASASAAAQPAADTPVRVAPLVQRVWVKRFVDANDMLVSGTVIYKEIVPAHWAGYQPSDSTPTNSQAAVYPHRPSKAPEPQAGRQRDGSAPSTTEFVQPGRKAEPADVANVPATPNGTASMPQ